MKRYVIVLFFILFFPTLCLAAYKYNSNTRTRDYCLEVSTQDGSVVNNQCKDIRVEDGSLSNEGSFFLIKSGATTGGYVSMTTSASTVDVSYAYIKKAIASDPAFQTGTLPDGNIGKLLTIEITEIETPGDTWTLTPTTSSEFDSIIFSRIGEIVTLVYIDDTNGWIRIHTENEDKTVVVDDYWYDAIPSDEIIFANTDNNNVVINLPKGFNGFRFKIINAGSSGNSVFVSQGEGIDLMGYGVSQELADGEILDIHYNSLEGWF